MIYNVEMALYKNSGKKAPGFNRGDELPLRDNYDNKINTSKN